LQERKEAEMRLLVGRMLAVVSALAMLAACGAVADDEQLASLDGELGTLEQALGSGCGGAGPVQHVFTARASPLTVTAAMQSQGCPGDTYVFSIQSYNRGLERLQNPSIRPATLPGTKAACEATGLLFSVWSRSVLQGAASARGTWRGGAIACELSLSAPATLVPGATYDFAISARRPASVPIAVRLEHPYR
jgi:hypothetical protein